MQYAPVLYCSVLCSAVLQCGYMNTRTVKYVNIAFSLFLGTFQDFRVTL